MPDPLKPGSTSPMETAARRVQCGNLDAHRRANGIPGTPSTLAHAEKSPSIISVLGITSGEAEPHLVMRDGVTRGVRHRGPRNPHAWCDPSTTRAGVSNRE